MKSTLDFSDDVLEEFQEKALNLLEKTGVYAPDRAMLDIMENAGFSVNRNAQRIKFPPECLQRHLNMVPKQIRLGAREPENDLTLDFNSMYVRPQSGCPNVIDLESGASRPATLQDTIDFARLNDALPHIHFCGALLYPSDVPVEDRDVVAVAAILKHCRKHLAIAPFDVDHARRMVRIAEVVRGGLNAVAAHPLLTFILGGTSPLVYSPNELAILRFSARSHIPIDVSSTPMRGATCPVTLASQIVLQHAENLAGIAMIQAVRPRASVIYGIRPSAMDMRTGAPVWGGIEWGMGTAALLQLARWNTFLTGAVGLPTDSKLSDVQCGIEKGMNMIFASLWGANIVLGAGAIDTIMAGSLDQLVIDNDIAGMAECVRRGIPVDEERLAVNVMEKIGPGGNYLMEEHTLKFMRSENFAPSVLDRQQRAAWETSVGVDAAVVARRRARAILSQHIVSPLPKEIVREIDQIAGHRT